MTKVEYLDKFDELAACYEDGEILEDQFVRLLDILIEQYYAAQTVTSSD